MLTHANLAFVTASWLADLTPMTEVDATLHAAPLTHGAGFHTLATTARGAHHVIPERASFDPAAILGLLASAQVTNTWMVPTQIVMLVDALGDRALIFPTSVTSSTGVRRSHRPSSAARLSGTARCSSSCSARARRR